MLEPIRISACDTTITGTNDTVDYENERHAGHFYSKSE